MMFNSILAVCIGNMCRSPIAEAQLRHSLPAHIKIASAGLDAPHGANADATALEAALEVGLDISEHRARRLTADIAKEHDLILVMERSHITMIAERFPQVVGKTKLISHFTDGQDIEDPYKFPMTVHRQVRDKVLEGVGGWISKLRI